MNDRKTAFLQALLETASGYFELRFIKKEDARQRSFPLPLKDVPWDEIQRLNNEGFNVYYSVCPRRREGGEKEDVGEIPALWVDLDGKQFDPENIVLGKELALKALDNLPPHLSPSIIVDSGNGYHAYWLLKEPEILENEADIRQVEGYTKGLAQQLGGDSTYDISRVMRLPGTLNVKDPANPLPCEITHFETDRRFNLCDFDDYWVEPGEAGTKATIENISGDLPEQFNTLLAKNRQIKDTWEGKRPDLQDQSRSGYDMAMADRLVLAGFSDNEIASTLVNMPSGRGKEARKDYLERTISKARALRPEPDKPKHSDLITAADYTDQLIQGWERTRKGELIGIKTSFKALNEHTCGLRGLNILASAPKVGKSNLVGNIGWDVAQDQIPVIIYDFENGRDRILTRLVCRMARVTEAELRLEGIPEKKQGNCQEAINKLRNGHCFHIVKDARSVTFDRIKRHVETVITPDGKVLLIFDSLQKLPLDLDKRREGIDRWLRHFEALRDEYGCTIILVCELKRSGQGRYQDAGLDSFKESGDIEYTGDTMFIFRDTDDEKLKQLVIEASRDCEPGSVAFYRKIYPYWDFTEE